MVASNEAVSDDPHTASDDPHIIKNSDGII